MRKYLTLMVMVGWSLGAWAEPGSGWLYWTLDLADDWGNAGTWERPENPEAGTYGVWLVAEKGGGDMVYFHDTANPETITLDATGQTGNIGGYSVADLSLLGDDDLSGYTFYSAIGSIAGDEHTAAWTSYRRGYDSLSSYIQPDEILYAGNVWNTAVAPEPTSGLLLLLGLAGLALKRKRS